MNESYHKNNHTNNIINTSSESDINYIGIIFLSLMALIIIFSICSFLIVWMKDFRYKGFLCCFIAEFLYFLNDLITLKPLIELKYLCSNNIQANSNGFFYNLNKKGREILDYLCINCLKSNRVGQNINISNIANPVNSTSNTTRRLFNITEMFFPSEITKKEILNDNCPICTEPIFNERELNNNNEKDIVKDKLQVVLELKCGHFFHNKCINEWYQKSSYQDCPLCKEQINVEKGYLD